MHISARAQSIQESAIRKLDATVNRSPEVFFHRLNIGQPDVPSPPEVLAAFAADDGPVMAYGPASGTPACVEACAATGNNAILFGDLNDPSSDIAKRVAGYPSQALRPDLELRQGVRYTNL